MTIRTHPNSRQGNNWGEPVVSGAKPPTYKKGRVCKWKGCVTSLNQYNGRKYCLQHDHLVDHTHRAVQDPDAKQLLAVLDLYPREWTHLRDHFGKDWPSERLNSALAVLENAGYYIEGRRSTVGTPTSHRLIMPGEL